LNLLLLEFVVQTNSGNIQSFIETLFQTFLEYESGKKLFFHFVYDVLAPFLSKNLQKRFFQI